MTSVTRLCRINGYIVNLVSWKNLIYVGLTNLNQCSKNKDILCSCKDKELIFFAITLHFQSVKLLGDHCKIIKLQVVKVAYHRLRKI